MFAPGRTYLNAAKGLALAAAVLMALAATTFAATNSPRDKYCDPWNWANDPDCDLASFQGSDVTGATGASGATGATGAVTPGDWTWPAPPKGKYAKIRDNGRTAVAPKSAPRKVKLMVRAANSLTKKPYIWGGGHSRWHDKGYDCSGAVSFVLRAGGFVSWPMVSGQLARWGSNGAGRWVRIYANSEHVFMVIAGLRFDTTPWFPGEKGPRWRTTVRGTKGFALRHPLRY